MAGPNPSPAEPGGGDPAHISLALGITLGLLASFIQSLGLTIQRKSHIQNDALPIHLRKPDYSRPVWLIGFTVYFTFNILGSIFQIGTLPLIILGPLGAISLLWNAILAKILLGDRFSYHLVAGTLLIGAGAVLIGFFGVLPEESNHDLDELIYLYSRTPFLIEIILLVTIFSVVCFFAHLSERKLNQTLDTISLLTLSLPSTPPNDFQQTGEQDEEDEEEEREGLSDRLPINRSPPDSSSPQSRLVLIDRKKPPGNDDSTPRSGLSTKGYRASYPLSISLPHHHVDIIDSHIPLTPPLTPNPRSAFHLSWRRSPTLNFFNRSHLTSPNPENLNGQSGKHEINETGERELPTPQKIAQNKMLIGVAYGATSGTLSGICLLFAKTGVELLIRSLTGAVNEFYKIQTWMILLILLVSALLQLWYLNKALKLVNPTLICPLAFCFYNLSSIVSSLVYYDQFKFLSGLQIGLISLGTVILLAGVWVVSVGSRGQAEKEHRKMKDGTSMEVSRGGEESRPLLENFEDHGDEDSEEHEEQEEDDEIRHAGDNRRMNRSPSPVIDSRRATSSSSGIDHLIRRFLTEGEVNPVRGFSIGLGAASPGFAIRPSQRKPLSTGQVRTRANPRRLSYEHPRKTTNHLDNSF